MGVPLPLFNLETIDKRIRFREKLLRFFLYQTYQVIRDGQTEEP